MYSPELGVKDLLVAAGVGVVTGTTGWQIKISRTALTPDTQLTIFRTGGREASSHLLLNEVTVQVQVRGSKDGYALAAQKAQDVFDALVGLPSQSVGGDRWDAIYPMGDVNFLQYDESDRPMFTVNLRILIEPATNALTHRVSL